MIEPHEAHFNGDQDPPANRRFCISSSRA